MQPEWVVCKIFHKNTDAIVNKSDSLKTMMKTTSSAATFTSNPLPIGYNFDTSVLPQMVDISHSYPTTNYINNYIDAYNSGCIDYSSTAAINDIQNQQYYYPKTTSFAPYCDNLSFPNPQMTEIDISSPAQYVGTPIEIKPQPTPSISLTPMDKLMAVKQYMDKEEENVGDYYNNILPPVMSSPEMGIVDDGESNEGLEVFLNFIETKNEWPGSIYDSGAAYN